MGPRIPRMGRGPTDLGGRSISRSMDCVDAGVSVAAYPMDRAQPELVRVEFDRRLTLELHGSIYPRTRSFSPIGTRTVPPAHYGRRRVSRWADGPEHSTFTGRRALT